MQLTLPLGIPSKLLQIRDCLLATYGPQRDVLRHDPTEQFVKAIISSCTRDTVSSAAFERLRAYLPSWDRLPNVDPSTVGAIIRDVTYASEKAADLVGAARTIQDKCGRFDLSLLADRSVEDSMPWLRDLHGVGLKVAAATINFSTLRKRVLAVDRHVLRVSQRLGLLSEKTGFERGFHMLMRLVPDDWDADDLYELHWLIKLHGQTRCSYSQPVCSGCSLALLCLHSRVSAKDGRTNHRAL